MLYDFIQIPATDKKLLRLFAPDKIQSFPFNTTYIIENGSSNNGSEGKTRGGNLEFLVYLDSLKPRMQGGI